jgi:heme/copper-type cytochrome/quinol oxidase subunit 4
MFRHTVWWKLIEVSLVLSVFITLHPFMAVMLEAVSTSETSVNFLPDYTV